MQFGMLQFPHENEIEVYKTRYLQNYENIL